MNKKSAEFPIFVTGTQRSGTTLLHRILDCSSQFWSRNELYPVHSLIFGAGRRNLYQQGEQLRRTLEQFLDVGLAKALPSDSLPDRIALFASAMKASAVTAGKPRWCLKDPAITHFLPQYADAFPEARFLILTRDPRAVCRSYLSPEGFTAGRPANWIAAAERWSKEVELQLDFCQQFPRRVLRVSYEDLVSDLRTELKKLCRFVEIESEAAMSTYYRRRPTDWIHSGNENILLPPDKGNADKWKSLLSDKQVMKVEAISCVAMAKLGYVPQYPQQRISCVQRWMSRVHDRLMREYRWQRYKFSR